MAIKKSETQPTRTTPKAIVFLNSLTSSFKTISYARKNPENILSKLGATKTRAVVKKSDLLEDERVKYQAFLDILGLPKMEDLGIVQYDSLNKFTYFSYPIIALKDDKVYLSIGADSQNTKTVYIPLEVSEKGGYTIKDFPVYLTAIQYEDQQDTTPYITFSSDSFKFFISMKVDKNASSEHIENAFRTGDLALYLKEFNSGCIVKFTSMFRPIIEGGLLPANGIFMVLTKGSISRDLWEGKPTVSSGWKIAYIDDTVGNLPILDDKNNPRTLKDASYMYASQASEMTADIVSNDDVDLPIYFVVVTGIHVSKKLNVLPSHSGALRFDYLPIHLQQAFKNQYQRYVDITNGNKTETLVPASGIAANFMAGDDAIPVTVVNEEGIEVNEHGEELPF